MTVVGEGLGTLPRLKTLGLSTFKVLVNVPFPHKQVQYILKIALVWKIVIRAKGERDYRKAGWV